MKEKHTIIPPWPLRVNGGPNPTEKDREDFKLLLGTAHIGHERYVEWKVGAVEAAAGTQLEGGDAQQGGRVCPPEGLDSEVLADILSFSVEDA